MCSFVRSFARVYFPYGLIKKILRVTGLVFFRYSAEKILTKPNDKGGKWFNRSFCYPNVILKCECVNIHVYMCIHTCVLSHYRSLSPLIIDLLQIRLFDRGPPDCLSSITIILLYNILDYILYTIF